MVEVILRRCLPRLGFRIAEASVLKGKKGGQEYACGYYDKSK
jgi:hypothetical protein